MKITKKIIALVAVVAMLAGLCLINAEAKSVNYLLLGDSIAFGQGIRNSSEACYGRIVADTNGYAYMNDAVSGSSSKALLKLLDDDLVAADIRNADIIQLSIGGNDFLTRNWLGMGLLGRITGNFSSFDSIAEGFEENIGKIISNIRSKNSHAVIIFQTVYNPNNGNWHDTYEEAVSRLNGAIRGYLKKHPGAYRIADVGSVISGHDEYIAADTIHPNAAGNIAIARYMLGYLKNAGLGSRTTPVINTQPIDNTGWGISYWFDNFFYALRLVDRITGLFS